MYIVLIQIGAPRYFAMFLWWIYQCLNIIILMNLLIAMMNTSMQVNIIILMNLLIAMMNTSMQVSFITQ